MYHKGFIAYRSNNGFTLLEVLLSIALIGTMLGLSLPAYLSFQASNSLDIAASNVVQSLRSAEIKAISTEQDSVWGVKIENNQITIFKGVDFTNRDQSFDEKIQFPAGIQKSSQGIDEIIFKKVTGYPQNIGIITLESTNGQKRNISINEAGTIST